MDESSIFFLTRISNHCPEKNKSTLIQATWDHAIAAPCIGCCHSNGIFEYKDIHTSKSQYYQIFETSHDQVISVNSQWGEFRFLCCKYPGLICFTLHESTQMYQTQFATTEEILSGFPNIEISSDKNDYSSFAITLLFDTQFEITTFELDHQCMQYNNII